MQLNETDRQYLNDVYATAYKKFFASTGVGVASFPLSYSEAMEQARADTEAYHESRRAEINAKADRRIEAINADYEQMLLGINNEASMRGLIQSTIVLQQLNRALSEKQQKIDRAEDDRDVALSKLGDVTDAKIRAAARKIMAEQNETIKLNHQVSKDSMDRFNQNLVNGGVLNVLAQEALDQEVYAEYLRFLLLQSPEVALSYVDDDPLFYYNLSTTYFNKLKAECERRGWRVQ